METITLIIGAGASKDIHPQEIGSGADLIRDISNRVTDRTSPNNPNLSNILLNKHGNKISRTLSHTLLSYFVARLDAYISTKPNPFIDEFLNEVETYPEYNKFREDFLFIGYFSIVFHILGYEGHASEKLNDSNHWLFVLKRFIDDKKILVKEQKRTELKIITFNYDRIIEEFFHRQYGDTCKEFCNSNIVHVYKKLGQLPWQDKSEKEGLIPFGSLNDNPSIFEDHIQNIELMYCNRKNLSEIESAKEILANSDSVYCFGYGFDKINNRLLELPMLEQIGENFKANIYPGGDPSFIYRREMTEVIRSISRKADIHYKSCNEFLNACLFTQH